MSRPEVAIRDQPTSNGICHAGIISYDVSLRGGAKAGHFTTHGKVHNMENCISKCCQIENCTVAMMLKDRCFTVVCKNEILCEKKPTPTSSNFNPKIAYVFRDKNKLSNATDKAAWETRGKHHQLLAERLGEISDEYTPVVSLSTAFNAVMIRNSKGDKRKKAYAKVSNQNYTHQQLTSPLRSYITTFFQNKNQSGKISKLTSNSKTHNCIDKAALRQNILNKIRQHNKNETFLVKEKLDETLNTLSNIESTDTKMEKIKTNDGMLSEYYNQGICNMKNYTHSLHDKSLTNSRSLVSNSSHETEEHMSNATLATALSQLTFWNISTVDDDPSCQKSDVLRNVTLKGGLHSGNFKDRGQMEDIKQCVRLCCLLQKCDLAFMLSNTCFSVECVSDALCEAVAARSNLFSPTICYVYRKGGSKTL